MRTACALVVLVSLTACSRLPSLTEQGRRPSPTQDEPAVVSPAPSPPSSAPVAGGLPAFPSAEGFGAKARGGRGGSICRVTTLAHNGPGSLQACFDRKGPRTVIFDVSGVIEGPLEIKYGQLTIAGQTAPAGITVKGGVVCDNVYDPNDCNDVIIRHVRFRGGDPDSLRIGGAHDVLVDHCSFAAAEDENVEITRSRNVTIQWSIIAEPRGEHYRWGGVLINYSTTEQPLDAITLHHNVYNGVAGRIPEISCEENGDGRGKTNCAGRTLAIELSNNVMWDVSDPIWFNRCAGTNQGNDCLESSPQAVSVRMNMVGNVLARRSSSDPDLPFAEPAIFGGRSAIFFADNLLLRGAVSSPAPHGKVAAKRHPFAAVTYTPASALVTTLARTAGAFPRDAMDARLSAYLSRSVDARPPAWSNNQGLFVGDALGASPIRGQATVDSDGDGLPDVWESAHKLNPRSPVDASSLACGGVTALECYLDELASSRVR